MAALVPDGAAAVEAAGQLASPGVAAASRGCLNNAAAAAAAAPVPPAPGFFASARSSVPAAAEPPIAAPPNSDPAVPAPGIPEQVQDFS